MMASDADFNGRFVTGVLSTGIYCLPSCRARKPKPENVRFFDTFADAREAGLRACRKCRPDAFERGEGDEFEVPMERLVEDVTRRPADFSSVAALADALAVGETKVFALTRRHYHTTPAALLAQARVTDAQRRLRETSATVTQIAFDSGFESLSAFYDHFERRTGLAPGAYRAMGSSPETPVVLALPARYPIGRILGHLGRDPESVSERIHPPVAGDAASRSLGMAEVAFGTDQGPGLLRLSFEPERVTVSGSGLNIYDLHTVAVRVLGLGWDPEGCEAAAERAGFGRLVEERRGLRLPLTPTPFDALVWAIVGQQVGLGFAYTLRRRLTERTGVRLPNGMVATPTPAAIAKLTDGDLLAMQFSHRKAEYVLGVARSIPDLSGSATAVERRLLATRGFGPWATNYVMMRGLGFADCVPLGDTGLLSGLRRLHDRAVTQDEVADLVAVFSPHRSLATAHLWALS